MKKPSKKFLDARRTMIKKVAEKKKGKKEGPIETIAPLELLQSMMGEDVALLRRKAEGARLKKRAERLSPEGHECSGECDACGESLMNQTVRNSMVIQSWVSASIAAGLSGRETIILMGSYILAMATSHRNDVLDIITSLKDEIENIPLPRKSKKAKSRTKAKNTPNKLLN